MKLCLIVDDSRTVRMVARRFVEAMGFSTAEAEDGRQALDRCRERMPDAILLDWNMPHVTGIEFLRALRKEPNGTTPVVVFCTTENDMSFISTALEAGANEYIMKPFDKDILVDKFSEAGLL